MSRKASASKTEVKTSKVDNLLNDSQQDIAKKSIFRPKMIIFLLIVLGVLYLLKSYIVAATVNNRPIFRYTIIRELEKQGGQQTLDSLITQELIKQEAQKKNVVISKEMTDKKLNELNDQLKEQGQSLDQILEAQGTTRENIVPQIQVQLMLEELLKDKIKITDEEIDSTYEEQKKLYGDDQDEVTIRAAVEENLRSQKVSENAQALIDELKKNSSIRHFVTY